MFSKCVNGALVRRALYIAVIDCTSVNTVMSMFVEAGWVAEWGAE